LVSFVYYFWLTFSILCDSIAVEFRVEQDASTLLVYLKLKTDQAVSLALKGLNRHFFNNLKEILNKLLVKS